MNSKHKSYLVKALGILAGLFILVVGYRAVRAELSLRAYEEAFRQVKHPQDTAMVDSFRLSFSYYPATYVDDSIGFRSASVIGEIRKYSGSRQDLLTFYKDRVLEIDELQALPVAVLPVEIQGSEQKASLKLADNFSSSPFDYDMLEELRHYYASKGMPKTKLEERLYLVYIVLAP